MLPPRSAVVCPGCGGQVRNSVARALVARGMPMLPPTAKLLRRPVATAGSDGCFGRSDEASSSSSSSSSEGGLCGGHGGGRSVEVGHPLRLLLESFADLSASRVDLERMAVRTSSMHFCLFLLSDGSYSWKFVYPTIHA